MLGTLLMTNTNRSTGYLQALCQKAMSTCMTENKSDVAAIAAALCVATVHLLAPSSGWCSTD